MSRHRLPPAFALALLVSGPSLAAGAAPRATPPPDSARLAEEGLGAMRAGRPTEAIRAFEKALSASPREGRALRGLAVAYAAVGDARFEELFRRLLASDPNDLAIRLTFVESLWQCAREDQGNREMERLLSLAPREGGLHRRYGLRLFDRKDFPHAVRELRRAEELGTADYDVLFFLGSALLEVGDFGAAEEGLRRAVKLAPQKVAARHSLGRVLLLRGKARAAVPELEAASDASANSAAVRFDLGRAREAAGDLAAAEVAYREALRIEPGFARTHYSLGTLLARSGRQEEARREIAIYEEAFQAQQRRLHEDRSRGAEIGLGRIELGKGRLEEALDQFQRHPEDPEALRGAAQALSRLGRHHEAARALERALLISPDDARLRYEREREYAQRDKR